MVHIGGIPWYVEYASGMKSATGTLEKVFVRLYRSIDGRNQFKNYVVPVEA
jgi:hypothetical protein